MVRLLPNVTVVASGRNGFWITDDFDCHVYLIDGGSEAALIDAGVGRDIQPVLDNIEAAGVPLGRVSTLLLTHGHADHSGGAAALRAALGCRVLMSDTEADAITSGDEEAVGLSIARRTSYYPADYRLQACPVDRRLVHGDSVRVGELTLSVIGTPGHSPGSLSFLVDLPGRRAIFCGDTVQFGDFGQFKAMISLLHAPGCSIEAYALAASRFPGLNVDALFPGHRGVCLRNGQRHLDLVAGALEKMTLPKSVLLAY